MIKKIMNFEIFYNLKKPFTYLFFVILFAQGVWYVQGTNDYYGNSNTLMNAPVIFYQNLSGMGMLLIMITAIISAGALARDPELKTAETLYPCIVNEKKFFSGKYFGILIVNLMVVLAYPLGMLAFPYLGIGTPEQFGPVPTGQVLHGFFLFTLPNLVMLVTLTFFLVVNFKKSGAAYVGVLIIMMIFITSVSLREKASYAFLLQLIDPFGHTIAMNLIDDMNIIDRNTAYLPVPPILLYNRLSWLLITAVMFIASFRKFNFKYFIIRTSKKKKVIQENFKQSHPHNIRNINFTPVFSRSSLFSKAFRFAWRDFKSMTSSIFFRIVMFFLFFLFLGYNFFWASEYYITTSHLPLTSVATWVRVPMLVMVLVMIMIFSGELLFKDRKSGVWQITDAMPTPSWVFILSRFITIAGVALIISTLLIIAGLVAQLSAGFTDIEWGLYFKDSYLSRFGWMTSLQIICMTFCIGSLFSSRLKGHVLSISIFLFLVISLDLKLIEQLRFTFPFVPGIEDYSEINGYGIFDTALPWYAGAWSSLSVIFILVSILFWNRGVDRTFKERLRIVKGRLNPAKVSVLVVFISLFGAFQYGIHDNLIVKAEYQTPTQEDAEAAAYEIKYKKYAETVQPKITNLDLKLHIYPEERKAVYKSQFILKNKSNLPIKKLHIDRKKFLKINCLACEKRELEIIEDDENLRHTIYCLSTPLKPEESIKLNVQGELHYRGFCQKNPQADLTYNGSVLGTDLLPYFGYNENRELDNNKDRLEQGLELIRSRADSVDNLFSRTNAVQSDQADFLSWDILVSTSGDQEVAGPGKLVKTYMENGRNYFQYRSEKPGLLNFKLISARFNKKEFVSGTTLASIYYHPRHTYNIKCMEDAVQKSMRWLSQKAGAYPYSSMRIVEKTFYDDEFVTFNNLTAISEKYGWTADISKPEDEEYIYYTIARELAKQWVESKVLAANVQGAHIFTESIPEYYALAFMDDYFGHGHTAKWLDENFNNYQEGKGEEEILEHVLLNVDKAGYVSREKGGLALYALAQQLGVETFNKWLNKWLQEEKSCFITSHDFYRDLKKQLPVSLHHVAEEWFEERTQYEMALSYAAMEKDTVTLEISAARGILDGLGYLSRKPLSALLEIGFFNGKGQLIETRKIRIKPGTHTYNLHLSFKPDKIILDPHYWYLTGDRKNSSIHKIQQTL